MATNNWTVTTLAVSGALIALNWAAAAHADPAPPPAPAVAAPSEAPPAPDAGPINNGPLWTGDYDDGDIYIIPIL
jgi:hypothetical protein